MEITLLLFVLIAFVAASYQVFLINRTVFRSLTAVHQTMFTHAFERNCSDHRRDRGCDYSQDPAADGFGGASTSVIWSPEEFPEITIPIVGMFRSHVGVGTEVRISSSRPDSAPGADRCTGMPCKRTRVGAGTYKSVLGGIMLLQKVTVDADSLMGYVEWAAFTEIVSVIQ